VTPCIFVDILDLKKCNLTAKAVVQMLTTAMWRDKIWVTGCTVRVSISCRDRGFISSPKSPDRL